MIGKYLFGGGGLFPWVANPGEVTLADQKLWNMIDFLGALLLEHLLPLAHC